MKYLNKRESADQGLFEVDFIPRGKGEMITMLVFAESRLGAYNYFIQHQIWGEILEVRYNHFASVAKNI